MRPSSRLFAFVLVALACVAFAAPASATPAPQTFTVTKTEDTNDGTCDGDCSLREAIVAANNAGEEETIIVPDGTYLLEIPAVGSDNDLAAAGDLDTGGPVIIQGTSEEGTIIDAGGNYRAFDTFNITMSDLTIRNGNSDASGGGIASAGHLTLTNVTLEENSAAHTGGGISADGPTMTLTDVTLIDNESGLYGGGVATFSMSTLTRVTATGNNTNDGYSGGGIYNGGQDMTITDSVITGNSSVGSSAGGGGIYNYGAAGLLTIDNTTVSGNDATGQASAGGGISNESEVVIRDSTISGNTAEYGGGIYNGFFATMELTNSTISGNTADIEGGGIDNENAMDLLNVTVTDNAAPEGAGLVNDFFNPADSIVTNTIIADNEGADCLLDEPLTETAHSLSSDLSCELAGTGDIQDGSALLGPLALNGGDTQTHGLLPGSDARDQADDDLCPVTDQRGEPRPIGDGCDIGSLEAAPVDGDVLGWGDSDCDGEVTARDNQALLRFVLDQNALSQTEPCPNIGDEVPAGDITYEWGDWDCDGEVTARDNQALLRFVLDQNALSQTPPCPVIGVPVVVY